MSLLMSNSTTYSELHLFMPCNLGLSCRFLVVFHKKGLILAVLSFSYFLNFFIIIILILIEFVALNLRLLH